MYALILAEERDGTWQDIAHWLVYNKIDFTVITEKTEIQNITYKHDKQQIKFLLELKDRTINSDDISCYYYRRGEFKFSYSATSVNFKNKIENTEHLALKQYFQQEWTGLTDTIHYLLKNLHIPSINSYFDIQVNKNINLIRAHTLGLLTPKTIITNSIAELEKLFHQNQRI